MINEIMNRNLLKVVDKVRIGPNEQIQLKNNSTHFKKESLLNMQSEDLKKQIGF